MPRTWPNILGLVNLGHDGVEALNSRMGQLPGWVVFNRSMARDRQVYSGDDYSQYTDANVGVICCLEWDQGEGGTIPAPGLIGPFLKRCQSYVEASSGCHVWIVGNEMNAISNWPLTARRTESISIRGDSFQVMDPRYRPDRYPLLVGGPGAEIQEGHFPVSPSYYVECYVQVRECIKGLRGHEQDLVLVGAVAPWNTDAKDAENPSGDWIQYFTAIVSALQGGQCEGFALHTASLGPDPDILQTDQNLSFPFGDHKAGFRCFEDYIAAVPPQHRGLPFFITETSQLQPWLDANDGWVFNACELIQTHNRARTNSPIRCLALYQWGTDSPWSIRNKSYLLSDIRDTLLMLADQSRKSALCEVVWEGSEMPEACVKGESFTTSVTFTNISEHALSCSGDDPARLAVLFQAVDSSDSIAESVPDLRYPLPEDVGVGAAQTCRFVLQAPPTTGAYRLYVGIVSSQFVWSSAGLEGALVCTVSVQESVDVESVSKPLKNSYEVLTAPSMLSGSGPLSTPNTEPLQPAVWTESIEPSEDSEDTHLSSFTDGDFKEPEILEKVVPDLAPPTKFEVYDLTAFFSASKAEVSKRLLTSLNRIVFVEAGLPASTPMDIYLDHFVELGLEGLPIHFLIENDGPVFQLLPLTTNPLSYSQNWASAMVLGLEGRANSQAEAKEKLHRAAKFCASILQAQASYGVSSSWEIGLDSVDGEIPFCNLTLEDLEEVGAAMHEQWQLLGMSKSQLTLTPIALLLEAKEGDRKREVKEEQPDPYFDGIQGLEAVQAADLGPDVSEDASELPAEEAPLWSSFPSGPPQEPIDLESDGSSHIEYTYREKTAVFLWATGSRNDVPITQLNRLHELQFGDILYHFVIASDGRVFETHRGPKPDEQLMSPLSEGLHIGLQGDFKQQFPPEAQTKSCILLLARLARKEEQLAAQVNLGTRPVTIGTEHWLYKDDWREKVLHQTSLISEILGAQKEGLSEDTDLSSILDTVSSVSEPDDAPAPISQAPGKAWSESGEIPAPRTSLSESVPRLFNKIGTMAIHPKVISPKRRLEQINSICIHHTSVPGIVGPEQIAQSLLLDQSAGDSPLHGLPYHFFVHPDGQIDQCVSLEEVCQGTENENDFAISVALAGKFTDTVNPTPDQLRSAATLISWLMREHFLNIEDIKGHKDIDGEETECPGEEWTQGRAWKESLLHYIR